MDIGTAVDSLVGASGGGAVVLVVARYYLGSLMNRVSKAEAKLQDLDEKRIAGLETRLSKFEMGCQAKHDRLTDALQEVVRMGANLASMVGLTQKMDSKIDRLSDAAAEQKARSDGHGKWLQNIDGQLQGHTRDRGIHHG